ncbi:hypothetical protein PR048_030435 [Dryococelus australis]|uniref:Uncharacterized protein n=1 Tax=Dryococelus australis TaxID=614101 RepID=A0ABQ9G8Z1_9NEOP|nr:hypothetical protein PR048_030435 [Dryococelus australis]
MAYPGTSIHLCTIAQQNAYDISLIGTCCKMERGLPTHRRHVRVGVMLQQVDDDVHAAHEAGHVQGGNMQWREAVQSASIGVCLAVKQQLGHAHMPAVGGHVQGCQVVDGHFIHWCTFYYGIGNNREILIERLTFVLELMGAALSNSMSTTCSCPDRAAQWSGVKPSLVFDSMFAPFSNRRDTMEAKFVVTHVHFKTIHLGSIVNVCSSVQEQVGDILVAIVSCDVEWCKATLRSHIWIMSSFLAAMCRAGSRTLPRVSFSSRTATTLSCPCCIATAKEWSSARMQGWGKWEVHKKTGRQAASSYTIPTCENPGVTWPGNEPGLPWWEASSLTAQPAASRPSHDIHKAVFTIEWRDAARHVRRSLPAKSVICVFTIERCSDAQTVLPSGICKEACNEMQKTNEMHGQALVGSVGQQKPDNTIMVFLGSHVERCEAILRLDCLILLGGHSSVVVRLLASHPDKPGSIPGGFAPGFSHVPDNVNGQLVFSKIARFLRPCIPAMLHTYLASPSLTLKTLMAGWVNFPQPWSNQMIIAWEDKGLGLYFPRAERLILIDNKSAASHRNVINATIFV